MLHMVCYRLMQELLSCWLAHQDKMIAASLTPRHTGHRNNLGLPPPRSTLPSQPRWTNNDSCTPTCHKPYGALPLQISYHVMLRQAKKHMQHHWSCRTCHNPDVALPLQPYAGASFEKPILVKFGTFFWAFRDVFQPRLRWNTLFQNQRRKLRNPL